MHIIPACVPPCVLPYIPGEGVKVAATYKSGFYFDMYVGIRTKKRYPSDRQLAKHYILTKDINVLPGRIRQHFGATSISQIPSQDARFLLSVRGAVGR